MAAGSAGVSERERLIDLSVESPVTHTLCIHPHTPSPPLDEDQDSPCFSCISIHLGHASSPPAGTAHEASGVEQSRAAALTAIHQQTKRHRHPPSSPTADHRPPSLVCRRRLPRRPIITSCITTKPLSHRPRHCTRHLRPPRCACLRRRIMAKTNLFPRRRRLTSRLLQSTRPPI